MARKSKDREMAELIHKAISAISDAHLNRTVFVKVTRVQRRKSLEPSSNQEQLYRFIKRRGFVPKEWTLGMHFSYLGGLMARGLVVPSTKDGQEGVVALER